MRLAAGTRLRCAWCHADLEPDPVRCAGCGTLLHTECLRVVEGCPTLGCSAPLPAPRGPTARERLASLAEELVGLAVSVGLVGLLVVAATGLLLVAARDVVGSF